MGIDANKFKDKLAIAFIELMESKRGVAAQLGKAINKPGGFFSEVKRGRPVNSLHLKAVGIVFGPEKVIELLAINEKKESKNVFNHKEQNDEVKEIIVKHKGVVEQFKNPEKGLRINQRLLIIEDISDELFDRVDIYIQGIHDAAQALGDVREIQGIPPTEEHMKIKPNNERGQGEEEERMDGTNGK